MTCTTLRYLAAGTALALMAGTALGQTPGATPSHGTVVLEAGFPDDPHSVGVRAGGAFDATRLDQNCAGFVNEAPNLALDYRAGTYDLYISAASDADTTLAVSGPDGSVHCDDDSGTGALDPGVQITEPASGRYQIWVGTYQAGIGLPPAMVHISETGFHGGNPYSRRLEPDAPAEHGATLRAGFRDDPRRFEVTAGGDVDAGAGGTGCFGFAGQAPDLALDYRAGDFPLFISGEGEFDGVLAIRAPDGSWSCDDDTAGDLDPGLVFAAPESGRYAIWYGTLGDVGEQAGTLFVSEIGFDGVDTSLDLTLPARHGELVLRTGFTPDPRSVNIMAGGELDADLALAGQTVAAGFCVGYVTREATLELDFAAGGLPLFVSASGEDDLTLMVNAPDGAWLCDDDSSDGVNPGLSFDAPQSGVYDIYVGTYSQGGAPVPAALHISELGFGPEGTIQPGDGDWTDGDGIPADISLPAIFGDHVLEAGFLPDPYTIDLTAGGPLDAADAVDDWSCPGYITEAPSVQLAYDGSGPLHVYVESDQGADTTLAVNTPDGSWRCDDDGGPGFDAGLTFETGTSGVYDIYVGTFGGNPAEARLAISEISRPQD